MADTNFTSGTVITSAWLNDLNDLFYTTLGGATTAAGVRSAISAAQSGANSDITSITGLSTPLSVSQGGTGGATAAAARAALGVASSGANSDITSLTALSTPLSVAQGGTGQTTTGGIRTAIGAAASGANSDITSLSALSTPLSVAQGGTGRATITANNVLLGNGTSAVSLVAPGASGNVLTSNGTTWQSSTLTAGSFVFLYGDTITVQPNVQRLNVTQSGTYDSFMIVGRGIVPAASDTVRLRLAHSTSTIDTSSVYYQMNANASTSTATDYINISNAAVYGGGSSKGLDFVIIVSRGTSNNGGVHIDAVYQTAATPTFASAKTHTHYLGTTADVSGFILYLAGGGNITSGQINVYGFKNS